ARVAYVGQILPISGEHQSAFGLGAEAARETRQRMSSNSWKSGISDVVVQENIALNSGDTAIREDEWERRRVPEGIARVMDAADYQSRWLRKKRRGTRPEKGA